MDPGIEDELAFERKLYVIRRRAENAIRYAGLAGGDFFYVPSMSSRTLIYKGMLTPRQVATFYPDLSDPLMETAIAVVHSRFSTNTFPSWGRAHPYRYLIHNGEINTLRGNENWMHARQGMLASELFGEDIKKVFPVIQEDGSDSAKFDNCLEFLALSGRSLPHAVMMMIPEPWENHESMDEKKHAFYEFHSSLMEPWDGPASIAFTDGTVVGAVLDRNGLRPSRYYVTKDDLVIMASEVGVLDVPPERVLEKRRLQPGRMFLGRYPRRAHHQRRRDQTGDGVSAAVRSMVERESGAFRRFAGGGGERTAVSTIKPRCSACKPSVIISKICASISVPWRRTAFSRWAPWVPTRRWRFCRTSRSCSTTISSSSLPRSPIRPSIRFAKS